MKIISRGNKNVECRRCGCVMEYDSRDIQHKIIRVSTSSILTYLKIPVTVEYINCPQCGKEIEIGRR